MRLREVFSRRVPVVLVGLVLAVTLLSSAAPAQEPAPRIEINGNYSYLNPGGEVIGPPELRQQTFTVRDVPDMTTGWGAGLTYNFNKWFGLTADFGGHYHDIGNIHTFMGGPTVKFRTPHFTPFVQALVGAARFSPDSSFFFGVPVDTQTGFAAALGGGLDAPLSRHIGWRVFQVDWLRQNYSRRNFITNATFDGVRVQGGMFLMFGQVGPPPVPPTASCSVDKKEAVLAGTPVTATVSTQHFNPKHKLTYDWKTTGGKLEPKETTATVDTTGLAPGSYTVSATVTDFRTRKNDSASCNASFSVRAPVQPTISCSANPTTVAKAGDTSTITATVTNPDNIPVTYAWKASAGSISGTEATATLDTTGAAPGPITVTGTVTDNMARSSNCTASVEVPPPPPPPVTKIGEIAFPNLKKPARVDNTAKAILDDVALRMQREPDAKAVIVGYFDSNEKGGVKLAQERAVNTKAYLTTEKGIDPARIEVRTGTAGGKRAEIYLVAPGGTFNVEGTQTFPEKAVKPAAAPKKKPRKAATKAPAAPAAAPKQ
ncbi:MAG: outer membrane beta-barrel protein [Terriglobales bacterium]